MIKYSYRKYSLSGWPNVTAMGGQLDRYMQKKYRGIFNKHILPVFGDMIPDDITAGRFKKFQVDLRVKKKLGKKSINNIRSAFSCLIQYINEEEISNINPLVLVKPPASKLFVSYNEDGEAINQKGEFITESIDPFTYDDTKAIIGAAEGQFKNIVMLQFFSGMRIGGDVYFKMG